MTELREKMIREMELRNLSENTQRSYVQAVYGLAKHYMQSPDKMSKEMIEDYLLYLKKDKGNAPATVGSAIPKSKQPPIAKISAIARLEFPEWEIILVSLLATPDWITIPIIIPIAAVGTVMLAA